MKSFELDNLQSKNLIIELLPLNLKAQNFSFNFTRKMNLKIGGLAESDCLKTVRAKQLPICYQLLVLTISAMKYVKNVKA